MTTALNRLMALYPRVMDAAGILSDELNKTGVRHVLEVHWPDESIPPRILVRPGTKEEILALDGFDTEPLDETGLLN